MIVQSLIIYGNLRQQLPEPHYRLPTNYFSGMRTLLSIGAVVGIMHKGIFLLRRHRYVSKVQRLTTLALEMKPKDFVTLMTLALAFNDCVRNSNEFFTSIWTFIMATASRMDSPTANEYSHCLSINTKPDFILVRAV